MGTHATKGPERYYLYLSALYIIDSISSYRIRAYRVACLTKPSSIQSLFKYLPNRDYGKIYLTVSSPLIFLSLSRELRQSLDELARLPLRQISLSIPPLL